MAYATRTFAPVSKTPIAMSAGSSARGGRSDVRVTKTAAATASATDAERAAATAQGALSSAPASSPTKKSPNPSAATTARPAPVAIRDPLLLRLARERDDPGEYECDADPLRGSRDNALDGVDRQRDHGRRGGDGRHDPHRAHCESAIERGEPDRARQARERGGQKLADTRERVPCEHYPEPDPDQSDRLREREHGENGDALRRQPRDEVAGAPRECAAERQQRRHEVLVPDGARRGLRVELVRVVEDRRLRRARRLPLVMCGDRVQELREGCRVEIPGALLDESQAEMDVAQ